MTTPTARGRADEGIRPGGTLEKLATLKTPSRPTAVISAGNASQISDGAAALLVTTSEKARELGLRPLVRVHTTVVVGDDPVIMLTAPDPGDRRRCSTVRAVDRRHRRLRGERGVRARAAGLAGRNGRRPGRLNPHGGAIALGHPLGGSGARLMTTLVHHMQATGIRYGLQTMCEGGGMANATILELLDAEAGTRRQLVSARRAEVRGLTASPGAPVRPEDWCRPQ